MKACQIYKTIAQLIGDNSITDVLKTSNDALVASVYAWAVESLEAPSMLSNGWNSSSPNYYTFPLNIKRDEDSNLSISKLGNEMVVNLKTAASDVRSCTLNVSTYVNGSFFQRLDSEDVWDMYKGDEAIDQLITKLNEKLLKSDGKEETAKDGGALKESTIVSEHTEPSTPNQTTNNSLLPRDLGDTRGNSPMPDPAPVPQPPLSVRGTDSPMNRDTPPGFDDEYEMDPHQASYNSRTSRNFPAAIGENDLYPAEIEGFPRLEPIIGLGGNRGSGPSHGHRGMFPTPEDILGDNRSGQRNGGGLGPRWDPTGPGRSSESSGSNRFNGIGYQGSGFNPRGGSGSGSGFNGFM